MDVTLDQAIEIHARAWRARYGKRRAVKRAMETAERLRDRGDHDGASVWERVAERVCPRAGQDQDPSRSSTTLASMRCRAGRPAAFCGI